MARWEPKVRWSASKARALSVLPATSCGEMGIAGPQPWVDGQGAASPASLLPLQWETGGCLNQLQAVTEESGTARASSTLGDFPRPLHLDRQPPAPGVGAAGVCGWVCSELGLEQQRPRPGSCHEPQAGGARKGAGSGLWGAVTRLRLFDVVSALET